jgi:hypothetical protein
MATILTAGPVRPADDLDGLLGDLLDLQHDLANVVVWLAETWPTDLPDLRPYGSGQDTAQLELWAYCDDLDQLTRAARLLGVPPVDDHARDSCGCRYSNARRAFGRVTIRAYTALPAPATEPAP